MSRKIRVTLAVGAAIMLGGALWAWRTIGHVAVQEIGRDVYVLTGIGGNVGVLISAAPTRKPPLRVARRARVDSVPGST